MPNPSKSIFSANNKYKLVLVSEEDNTIFGEWDYKLSPANLGVLYEELVDLKHETTREELNESQSEEL